VGWEKVACWSTKAAISLKRIKIKEMLLWRTSRKSNDDVVNMPNHIMDSPFLVSETMEQQCSYRFSSIHLMLETPTTTLPRSSFHSRMESCIQHQHTHKQQNIVYLNS